MKTARSEHFMNKPDAPRNVSSLPPLWSHQKQAVKIASERFALFFDPGTGKSRTALEIIQKHRDINKVIIYAPVSVCPNWINEIGLYYKAPYQTYFVCGQTKTKKFKELTGFMNHSAPETAFLICNTESIRGVEYRSMMEQSGADCIIADESHMFKSPSASQTKGLFSVVKQTRASYLYLLTGTPAPNGEIDLWSTFALMGKTRDNFFIWRKKHFIDKNERRRGHSSYWPEYVISPSSRNTFQALLKECSLTARKDEVLDLPELLRLTLYAEMSPEQSRHYETMKEFLFAIDEEGNELNATNMLTRTLRLQQILAGFVGEGAIDPNPRLSVLKQAITDYVAADEQFIIWTIFKDTYRQISEMLDELNISYGMLTGLQTVEERTRNVGQFQGQELRALVAHPKAGGIGINLTAASYSIHYTRSFSLTDDLQAEARNYRGGSERHKHITRIDIVTPGTIDEEITKALRDKKSVQEFLMGLKRGV